MFICVRNKKYRYPWARNQNSPGLLVYPRGISRWATGTLTDPTSRGISLVGSPSLTERRRLETSLGYRTGRLLAGVRLEVWRTLQRRKRQVYLRSIRPTRRCVAADVEREPLAVGRRAHKYAAIAAYGDRRFSLVRILF
ncbi:hypothetical protein LSH36_633g00010 [Paralvinella palmiformis]|uniref:Uncharacterized protein n=1 Tax=Paralvinella palmiformis TaxID=53620 RepID=A0AAD9J476_9ANNE|nr:hypothetical protein LSH36_633g00010 [Paralvinella palmiformis]